MPAKFVSIAVTILLTATLFAQPDTPQSRILQTAHALTAQYNQETGLFKGTGWWNSANAITALADTSRILHTTEFDDLFANTLAKAPSRFPLFRNEYYDDEGWWALAWIDVYQLHHDPRYLAMAKSIFSDMTGGWGDTCGGGIWWKKDSHYKNAIANELFLAVAAHLAELSKGKEKSAYKTWATREWAWFQSSGMINPDNLINDGLTSACKNNEKTTWTYNQGVILDGLTTLSHLAEKKSTQKEATLLSQASLTHLIDKEGILHDPCEPKCGEDGIQFKGIFARDLAHVQNPAIPAFLTTNAQTAWTKARTPETAFACTWSGPAVDDKTGATISVLDLLNAAYQTNPTPGSR